MKLCKTCSNQFITTKHRTTFCSHTCQARHAITIASKNRKPKQRNGVVLNCKECQKEYYIPKYRFKAGKSKYCSRACLAKDLLPKYVPIHGFKPLNKPLHKYKYIRVNGVSIREHRYIMEQHLGRKLERWEHVHHINDDSSDNRIENLEVLSNSDHQRKEYEFRKKIAT